MIAYNGETCDLKWIWRLTQAPGLPYVMPKNLKYFIDPLRVIKNYKGCKLNPVREKKVGFVEARLRLEVYKRWAQSERGL